MTAHFFDTLLRVHIQKLLKKELARLSFAHEGIRHYEHSGNAAMSRKILKKVLQFRFVNMNSFIQFFFKFYTFAQNFLNFFSQIRVSLASLLFINIDSFSIRPAAEVIESFNQRYKLRSDSVCVALHRIQHESSFQYLFFRKCLPNPAMHFSGATAKSRSNAITSDLELSVPQVLFYCI